ncbi:MAG: hypothetical protein KJ882_03395 [Proteobacteria bacterium]|nr:hypothetical protein [Pseudomonadota bacterium]MBU4009788.1 hypothetical protein [Pseudomonadota bacterium]
MLINVTPEMVEADIQAFEIRLQKAQDSLAELPEGYLPYPEYKKREKARHEHQEEISHVNCLIGLAREAL